MSTQWSTTQRTKTDPYYSCSTLRGLSNQTLVVENCDLQDCQDCRLQGSYNKLRNCTNCTITGNYNELIDCENCTSSPAPARGAAGIVVANVTANEGRI
jgi:hypothetical protein